MLTDITFEQDMKLHIQEDCRLFELSYCVSGEINCDWSGKSSRTVAETGNVLFLEDVRVYEEKKAGVRNQLVEVRFTPDELLHYAEDDAEKQKMETWLRHHRGNIDQYPITPALQKCVSEMIHCAHLGSMKRLYMESKALELLALFGESDGYGAVGGSLLLRREDISKLELAHALVQQHLEQPLSIRELAKRIGMNEFKLKKGFRELFGITVFELVRQKRMEKALWYLEVARLNVGEAGRLGRLQQRQQLHRRFSQALRLQSQRADEPHRSTGCGAKQAAGRSHLKRRYDKSGSFQYKSNSSIYAEVACYELINYDSVSPYLAKTSCFNLLK